MISFSKIGNARKVKNGVPRFSSCKCTFESEYLSHARMLLNAETNKIVSIARIEVVDFISSIVSKFQYVRSRCDASKSHRKSLKLYIVLLRTN